MGIDLLTFLHSPFLAAGCCVFGQNYFCFVALYSMPDAALICSRREKNREPDSAETSAGGSSPGRTVVPQVAAHHLCLGDTA
jgi:hypothetical protein